MSELISDLEITGLAHGGRGIGRSDGKAVFVPFTAPGDRVVCRPVRSKSRYVEAELVELVEPSAQRREPPCPYFGRCGGCQWQHLAYPAQTEWKQRIFTDQLLRGGIAEPTAVSPIVPATQEWHYRNRVQFKCHMTATGLVIGFYRSGSRYVVDIERCLLLPEPLQRVLDLLRAELPEAPVPDQVPQVDVACGDDGGLRVLLHALPPARDRLRPWLQGFARRHRLSACLQAGRKDTIELVHGDSTLTALVDQPPLALEYGPGGFAQVNPAQNRRMVAEMLAILDLQGTEHVLELYCGMGNFSLPIARRAARLTGVEEYAPSVASACDNAASNGLDNVAFRAADAATVIADAGTGAVDLVVLDPPRSGSYQVCKELLQLKPRRVLYISCEPATLARDLTPLVHGGYRVVSARVFDLFPQTWHIESMTLLERG